MNAPQNRAMREAMRRAALKDTPGARDLAYDLAERQRDERDAPRTSRDYDRFMADKGRRIAGARRP